MYYLGDVKVGRVLRFAFDTQADGLPATLSATTVRVYKDASTTESSTGITLTADYDARTGLNHVAIDTSTDGTFYSSGSDFMVVLTAGTLNGQTIMRVLGNFSIENRTIGFLPAAAIQAIWDALTSALTTVGSIGKRLADDLDATISSRLAAGTYAAPLDAAGTRAAVGLASANLDTQLAAVPTANANADALLDRADAIETGWTLRKALRIVAASVAGKLSGAATTAVTIRSITDAKDRITATVDANGNRTAITLDGA